MDPLSLLIGALATGAQAALKDTASNAIKDAYSGLKTLIVRKFGKKPSIDSLEEKPSSTAKRAAVAEDLGEVKAAADSEVMALAKAVVKAVERDDPGAGNDIGLDLSGISAEFLKVGDITSSGTAARLRDSEFTGGITLGNLKAGDVKSTSDP
jgi:hypothetical protein